MNRRPPGLLVSQAIPGFLQYKAAAGLSPRTLQSYEHHLKQWVEHISDKPLKKVTTADLRGYLVFLRQEFQPFRLNGKTDPLSPKSLHNVWITFSSFFTWASQEFNIPTPMRGIARPKFPRAPVEVFSREEIEALLKACVSTGEARPGNRRSFVMRRSTADRDQAIILMLLDTGLRASELCALKVSDVDGKTGKVDVKHGADGGAKGGKGRTVYLGKTGRRALWRYLVLRGETKNLDAPLFLGKMNRAMNRDTLRQMISALGRKAGVKKCHPHRFRHTFAITYLRSGGDVFTLQSLLGHSTLDMVAHYTRIAQTDIEKAHQRASPADNWHL